MRKHTHRILGFTLCIGLASATSVLAANEDENNSGSTTPHTPQASLESKLSYVNTVGGKPCGFNPEYYAAVDNASSTIKYYAIANDAPITVMPPSCSKAKELLQAEVDKLNEEKRLAKQAGYESELSKAKPDDCQASTAYGGGNFQCKKTKNLIEAAKAAHQGGQMIGSTAVNLIGQKNQAKLANDFRMSSNFKAQEATSQTAMTMSSGMAMANTMLAIQQAKKGNRHTTNTNQLKVALAHLESNNCVYVKPVQEIVPIPDAGGTRNWARRSNDNGIPTGYQNTGVNLCQQIRANVGPGATDEQVATTIRRMIAEQDTTSQAARQGAFASTMNAAQSYATAVTSQMLANQQRKTAKQFSDTEKQVNQIAGEQNAIAALTMNNSGYGEAAATAEDGTQNSSDQQADNNAPGLDLGAPNDPTGGTEMGTPPVAGIFKQGRTPGGAGAGGGGGVGGGGGGAPSAGNQDEGKPAYAAGFEGKDRYESAGTMVSRGGAGGGGGAKADSGGIDFNSILANFLPQKNAADEPTTSILDIAGRAPASTPQEDSYLDKNADIFQRIHQTYQEKQARRQLGI